MRPVDGGFDDFANRREPGQTMLPANPPPWPGPPWDSSAVSTPPSPPGWQTNPKGLRAERLVSLAQVAVDQVRIVSRDQLHELGWRHHHVEHEILTGRWTRVAPSVVALQNAPLTYEQRLWLGVLHASPRGCLSHGTACQ